MAAAAAAGQKLRFHETVGAIFEHLDRARAPGSAAYRLLSAFPRKILADRSQTLLDAGLTPNAALVLQLA